jgi:hypothetical protein
VCCWVVILKPSERKLLAGGETYLQGFKRFRKKRRHIYDDRKQGQLDVVWLKCVIEPVLRNCAELKYGIGSTTTL